MCQVVCFLVGRGGLGGASVLEPVSKKPSVSWKTPGGSHKQVEFVRVGTHFKEPEGSKRFHRVDFICLWPLIQHLEEKSITNKVSLAIAP